MLQNLALVLSELGGTRFAEAEKLFLQARELSELHLRVTLHARFDQHNLALAEENYATVLSSLARLYQMQNRFAAAEVAYRLAVSHTTMLARDTVRIARLERHAFSLLVLSNLLDAEVVLLKVLDACRMQSVFLQLVFESKQSVPTTEIETEGSFAAPQVFHFF